MSGAYVEIVYDVGIIRTLDTLADIGVHNAFGVAPTVF